MDNLRSEAIRLAQDVENCDHNKGRAESELESFRELHAFKLALGSGSVQDATYPYGRYTDKWSLRIIPNGDMVGWNVESSYGSGVGDSRGFLSENEAFRLAIWLADYFGWNACTLAKAQGSQPS